MGKIRIAAIRVRDQCPRTRIGARCVERVRAGMSDQRDRGFPGAEVPSPERCLREDIEERRGDAVEPGFGDLIQGYPLAGTARPAPALAAPLRNSRACRATTLRAARGRRDRRRRHRSGRASRRRSSARLRPAPWRADPQARRGWRRQTNRARRRRPRARARAPASRGSDETGSR